MEKIFIIIIILATLGCSSIDNRERSARENGDIHWNERLIFMMDGYRGIIND